MTDRDAIAQTHFGLMGAALTEDGRREIQRLANEEQAVVNLAAVAGIDYDTAYAHATQVHDRTNGAFSITEAAEKLYTVMVAVGQFEPALAEIDRMMEDTDE